MVYAKQNYKNLFFYVFFFFDKWIYSFMYSCVSAIYDFYNFLTSNIHHLFWSVIM